MRTEKTVGVQEPWSIPMFRLCRSPSTSPFEDFTCPEFETRRFRFALLALAPAVIVSSALSALFGMN